MALAEVGTCGPAGRSRGETCGKLREEATAPGAPAPQPETPPAGVTAATGGGKGRSQGRAGGARPAAKKPTAAGAAGPEAASQPAGPSPRDGVAALVVQAKALVQRLG